MRGDGGCADGGGGRSGDCVEGVDFGTALGVMLGELGLEGERRGDEDGRSLARDLHQVSSGGRNCGVRKW